MLRDIRIPVAKLCVDFSDGVTHQLNELYVGPLGDGIVDNLQDTTQVCCGSWVLLLA